MHSKTATLLLITTQSSEAERLVATLREDGLASKSVSIPNAERLGETITQRGCDIIICFSDERDLNLDEVLTAYRKSTADIPLILVTDGENHAGLTAKARRSGARDLVERGDSERLKLAVRREFSDLVKRREAQALNDRLKDCEQRSLEIIEVTSAGVAFIQDGLHIETNPAYPRLFGFESQEEVLATPFLDLIDAGSQKRVRDILRPSDASSTSPAELDLTCKRTDGSLFEAHLLAAPAEYEDEPCLRLILKANVPQPIAQTGSNAAHATGNELGLISFLAEIETHIGQDRNVERPFAIFYIRIKKSVDLLRDLGLTHALELFEEFAKTLDALVADKGFLARLGDDGFGLLVDGLGEFEAKALAEKITSNARLPNQRRQNGDATADCEIGYFLVSDRAAAAEDIVNAAHRLCIGHDFTDRDHVPGQQPPTSLAARVKQEDEDGDVTIARKIEYALRNDQLKLVYQPIISLMGDSQENYSVLIRLLDEEENLLEAKDFIGPAIRGGLIEEVDKWAIRSAIRTIGEQRKAGHNLSLFLNLSEDTFRNPSIVLWICDCLREFDVRGNWLTFQFQEELVVGNLASIGKLVDTLKKIKCRVAINRFGVSERPELILQGLSLDYVLLKPSFAQSLADDAQKQQRLLQLATLAKEFNVKSIVTGVEDARALTVLWTAGVDYVQGNFLQRPSPSLEVQA
ncbi:PAS/PAC domain protein [Imhoffiella purpurea]|uniref:PAS/PAC domain protein n=1 Tax=Imhoffiella purpurea TaxID=1249627 RepID=W9VED8_9GAMM|nr:PAS/PAC domain protein [Imhoffiella purpurea]